MKVKIIKNYYDSTKDNKLIKAGTEFEVSAERGKVLVNAGVATELKSNKDNEKDVEK